MLLSASEILNDIRVGHIQITPFNGHHLRKCSIRICLGHNVYFQVPNSDVFELDGSDVREVFRKAECKDSSLVLEPNTFVLAESLERISLPKDRAGILFSLSSLARIGIDSIRTSCLIQPEFGLREPLALALELHSVAAFPIRIPCGFPLAQLTIIRVATNINDTRSANQIHSILPDFQHLLDDMETME